MPAKYLLADLMFKLHNPVHLIGNGTYCNNDGANFYNYQSFDIPLNARLRGAIMSGYFAKGISDLSHHS